MKLHGFVNSKCGPVIFYRHVDTRIRLSPKHYPIVRMYVRVQWIQRGRNPQARGSTSMVASALPLYVPFLLSNHDAISDKQFRG